MPLEMSAMTVPELKGADFPAWVILTKISLLDGFFFPGREGFA